MNIVIFDTETTSLDKPFCYNIGYIIVDSATGIVAKKADYVIEQVWHNPMLFSTAYYADKRPIYVKAMRGRTTMMDKFGYVCQTMIRDFKKYNVVAAFAFNSSFDEKVFAFNCDWFRCINPFDTMPIYDIRGYAHRYICDDNYKNWCEENEKFSESGNYSTTAENVYRYISGNLEFIEEHTALSDSIIETRILFETFKRGAQVHGNYTAFRSLERVQKKTFTVKMNSVEVYNAEVTSIRYMKKNNTVLLKG